jgi:hypothetical protein
MRIDCDVPQNYANSIEFEGLEIRGSRLYKRVTCGKCDDDVDVGSVLIHGYRAEWGCPATASAVITGE